jgi:hypothetical protein
MTTMATIPAYCNSLSWFPVTDIFAYFIYYTCYFMSRNSWILYAWEQPLFSNRITMADAASLDLDAYLFLTGLWNISVHDFKWTIGFGNWN